MTVNVFNGTIGAPEVSCAVLLHSNVIGRTDATIVPVHGVVKKFIRLPAS